VDNAIVVLENIVRVRVEEARDRREAAVRGTDQVIAAIVTSTLTTLVVFLPLVFVRGQTGLLFRQLGYVVSFSLVCSLMVSLTLVPMLAARLMRKGEGRGRGVRATLAAAVGTVLRAVEESYHALLAGSLRWRWLTLLLVALAFAGSLEVAQLLGTEFLPATDEGEVQVTAEMEVGTRIEIVDREVADIERIVREEVPEALYTTVNIGPNFRRATASSEGEIRITLVPATERKRSSEEIATALRRKLTGRPGMVVRTRAGQGLFILRIGFQEQNALVVDIRGHEFETLHQVAAEVERALDAVPGVVDVRLSSQTGAPEALLRIDRDRAADLGLTVADVASTLETAIAGSDAGDYREGGDEVRILLKVAGSERMAMDEILDFTITNDAGEQVMLRNVVATESHRGPVVIDRKNQQRVVLATAGIEGRDLGSVAQDVQEALRSIPLPRGYDVALAGDYEEQQEAFGELMMGLLLSLVLVYMVMACLYESLVDPLVVMFSVPLAAIGVVTTLLLTDTTFNVQSFIGCIMLGGIVVNNAILIVDQASALRREGRSPRDAVMEAGRRRLRPILMTTLTTVLGLLPLALGIGEGAEAQAPMARAVVGGLASSTLITLVVVPIVYLLFHREKRAA
jgi:HAE1 family hydrophobic/amphiphilic exporter-1